MAINDINIISPVESLQNIIVPHEKKEKNKKEEENRKPAKDNEQEQEDQEKDQQAVMANTDKHLLDFKA